MVRGAIGRIKQRWFGEEPEADPFSDVPPALRQEMAERNCKLGWACALEQNFMPAVRKLELAMLQKPDYAMPHLKLGIIRVLFLDYAGGVKHLDRALEVGLEGNTGLALLFRGAAKERIYRFTGDGFKKAIPDYDAAIHLCPQLARAYRCRGQAKFGMRDLDGALSDMDMSIHFAPYDPLAHLNRSVLKLWLDDSHGAQWDYMQAIWLDSECSHGCGFGDTIHSSLALPLELGLLGRPDRQ